MHRASVPRRCACRIPIALYSLHPTAGLTIMNVLIDFCVVPLGIGVSVSPYITRCQEVLEESGLNYRMHSYGTSVEGDWDAVMAAVKQCHEAVHAMGAPRIHTTLRLGTRTDRAQTMQDKIDSVVQKLERDPSA